MYVRFPVFFSLRAARNNNKATPFHAVTLLNVTIVLCTYIYTYSCFFFCFEQLLEMGFRPAIEAILRYMPKSAQRQTLLFSATMPRDVRNIAQLALKDRYEFVDCVGEEESTHQHVPQHYSVCKHENQVK